MVCLPFDATAKTDEGYLSEYTLIMHAQYLHVALVLLDFLSNL